MVGLLFVVLIRILHINGCNPLFLHECAEDSELEHVANVQLLVVCLKS